MQDIDFDEIDRAVSSVTNSDSGAPAPTVSAEPVVSSTPVRVETPSSEPTVPSPAARRSTGRFMDVVHPSSDMRPTADTRPKGPSAPSLHREDVAPVRNEVTDRPAPAAVASSAFHWPDPIELAEKTPEPEEAPTPVVETPAPKPESEPEPVTPSVIDDLIDDTEEEAAPLESPFLTDAKVEKRPLGAFSTPESGSELPLLEDFPAPSAHLQPEVQKEEVPAPEIEQEPSDIPRELHEDVLLLDTHAKDEEEPELLVAETETHADDIENIPVGPTSITQQYKEQPSSANEPSGSIFDTEAYHQALTHPAKKRSRATLFIWLAALIVVGGGLGAGIYFVVLPLLG